MTAIFSRWQRGDQYDWLSGYLAARGVSGITRALMAFISTSMVLCLIALLFGSDGPRGTGADRDDVGRRRRRGRWRVAVDMAMAHPRAIVGCSPGPATPPWRWRVWRIPIRWPR